MIVAGGNGLIKIHLKRLRSPMVTISHWTPLENFSSSGEINSCVS